MSKINVSDALNLASGLMELANMLLQAHVNGETQEQFDARWEANRDRLSAALGAYDAAKAQAGAVATGAPVQLGPGQ